MDIQKTISQRVRQLLEERDLALKPFAQKLGIHNFGRILRGERNWTLEHLEKVAKALNVSISSLTDEYALVPILREVSSREPFAFPRDLKDSLDWVPAPQLGLGEKAVLAKMYGIRVKENGYSPILRKGSTLIAQKDTSDQIEEEDIVIYSCPQGFGHIGRVFFHDDKILFRPLNPAEKDRIMDRGQINMMDRVISVLFTRL
jgi:transcriptional regulator with XRE-family HTH domain